MKRLRTIIYWEFNIDIVGPRFETLTERRKVRKILSRKLLRDIEQTTLLATKTKLPAGFTATLS